MADKIISDLESVVAVLGDMLLPLENSIGTFSGSVDDLKDYIIANFPDASQTVKGKIEIATNGEVAAGTDTGRAIVPSALASLFGNAITGATSGTIILATLGTGGTFQKLGINYGTTTIAGDSSQTVTFDTAFTSFLTATASYFSNSTALQNACGYSSATPAGMVVTNGHSASTAVTWIAFGFF